MVLSPDYLLCIENRSQLTRRACGRNSDNSPAMGLCGTVSNPTLHLGYREVWGGMWAHGMGLCCAEGVRRSLGAARSVLVP